MKKIKSEIDEPKRVFKNPLMQTLGMVLQKMRNVLVLSSDDTAAKLGLGGSSYRMVEAGSAVLQPGKAIQAIKLFDRLEFEPLSRILVAIQVIESGTETIDDMQAMTKQLSEADPELAQLLLAFEPLWSIVRAQDSNAVADAIRERRIELQLENFLTTPRPRITDQSGVLETHVKSLLAKTPPFYIDLSLDLLENLQGYVPRVTPEELAKWEEKNKPRILNILGVIRDDRAFTDINNFKLFDYSFLWEDHFDRLRVICLSRARKDALKDFSANLRRHIETSDTKSERRLARFDESLRKVELRWSGGRHQALDELLRHESLSMNNLWFYTLRGGNTVAFADNSSMDSTQMYYGTSFSFSETMRRFQSTEKIWNEIDTP